MSQVSRGYWREGGREGGRGREGKYRGEGGREGIVKEMEIEREG